MKRLLFIIILFGFAGCNQKKVSCDFYQKLSNERIAASASPGGQMLQDMLNKAR